MKKWAIVMDMPEDKRAGYYAQIVKALAGTGALFDRYKEILITDGPEAAAPVLDVLDKYNVASEQLPLRLLDKVRRWLPAADDAGFVSLADHHYLFDEQICLFRFAGSEGDREQAAMQMEEHLLAEFEHEGQTAYAAERSMDELMTGIAKAYGCRIAFLE